MQADPNRPDFGYWFATPTRPGDPGHPRLEVRIHPQPTYHHFDPELVQLLVESPYGGSEVLRIKHPWTGPGSYTVFPDRIILQDRIGKVEEAFTFGGDLLLESTEAGTTCIIASPAPILHLTYPTALAVMLAEEVEILLAEQRAAWIGESETLSRRLANVPPVELYASCLETLRLRMHHRPVFYSDFSQKLVHFVNTEAQRLRQAGQVQPPVPLDQLLGRSSSASPPAS